MTGMESEREQRPTGICGVGAGGGPNRSFMGVRGEDWSDNVGVIYEGGPRIVTGLVPGKPRTPPSEIRENAEGALPAP
jgi:hypothetical protein